MNTTKLNKDKIREIIPHRSPILLVDSAVLGSNYSETSFFADPGLSVFEGHFPADPVLPGVYIIEAMAQCADIFLLYTYEHRGKAPLLGAVKQMRFLRPVNPGDTLCCHAELIDPITAISGSSSDVPPEMYDFRVSASVDGKKTAQGIITLCLK